MKKVTLKQEELILLFSALNMTDDGRAKTYPVAQLPMVMEVMKQMKKVIKDDKITGTHELNLGTQEMKLILDNLEARNWAAGDAEYVLSLKEKLS